jgi:hypothetical protein
LTGKGQLGFLALILAHSFASISSYHQYSPLSFPELHLTILIPSSPHIKALIS